jgi:hypothetical protein
MRNTEHGTRNTGYGIQDTGYGIRDTDAEGLGTPLRLILLFDEIFQIVW